MVKDQLKNMNHGWPSVDGHLFQSAYGGKRWKTGKMREREKAERVSFDNDIYAIFMLENGFQSAFGHLIWTHSGH